ncbi:NUDIX hydrolase [Cerasicoccus arenae]|uniref:GDP-mannose pyrophosphatase n=1 Tax=Cerasicoccus arenae TaxID=424488 RepID=A0A8J3GDC9_9BACT|nr:NUDIX hydrolase [Cerasicoccus arenae]MBK1857632.1 NUDIX hydrolase [Cerasicoccus arenae]GHC05449.1 NUDIX hydrolase [Cerasicoccus arenae]
MSHLPPANWDLIRSTHHADCKVYEVVKERFRHPGDEREDDFYTMKCRDWVLVLALTADKQLVLVNQFRFGVRSSSWEMPGGVIDDEDADPMIAGPRELVEETGYEGDPPHYLGWCHPNPALQNNRAHFIVVENCHLRQGQNLDPNEELQVKVIPVDEAYAMMTHCEITHSMAINALFWLQRYLAGEPTPGR